MIFTEEELSEMKEAVDQIGMAASSEMFPGTDEDLIDFTKEFFPDPRQES